MVTLNPCIYIFHKQQYQDFISILQSTHRHLLIPIIVFTDLELYPFLMETKLGIYKFFFFGMCFSGVTLDHFLTVKPVYPVAIEKADISLRCFAPLFFLVLLLLIE